MIWSYADLYLGSQCFPFPYDINNNKVQDTYTLYTCFLYIMVNRWSQSSHTNTYGGGGIVRGGRGDVKEIQVDSYTHKHVHEEGALQTKKN